MSVADFFCGAGGFSEGFRQEGFEIKYAMDNWKPAIETHELNHPNCINDLRDILELKTPKEIDNIVPDTDIIVGSPPCVAFSGSNKAGKADKSLGVELIKTYLRIVAWKKKKGVLKYWILENVPNSGNYIKDKYTWEELGLQGKGIALIIKRRNILNSANYGAPQTRQRFVCGDYPEPIITNNKSKWITMKTVMNELGNPLESNKVKKIIEDPVHKFKLESSELTDHFYDSTIPEFEWKKARRLKEDHGFMGKMSFPEYLDRPSRTVMATMSSSTREAIIFQAIKNGKNIGYRAPTIREVATFMGFPINYQFSGNNETTKYKQVGNAVCVPMSSALAKAIKKAENINDEGYIKLPKIDVPFNLNNIKKSKKYPNPRRDDAKFAVHIPYLKMNSFRVELSNKFSNFKSNKIIWKSILHSGTGKNAKIFEITQKDIQKILNKESNFNKLKEKTKTEFKNVKLNHKQLQDNYSLNQEKIFNPDYALEIMKKIIDEIYPSSKYDDVYFDTSVLSNKIDRKEIPLRIVAGLYVCNYFVEILSN